MSGLSSDTNIPAWPLYEVPPECQDSSISSHDIFPLVFYSDYFLTFIFLFKPFEKDYYNGYIPHRI